MLYCWGNNTDGQLGLERTMTLVSAPARWDYFQSQQLHTVGCGEKHTLFLTSDGIVFACGANNKGQCGKRRKDREIAQIQALETFRILYVACGKEHSLAVCDQGNVFAWGCGKNEQLGFTERKERVYIPKKIEQFSSIHIIQIACGHHHSVALSKDGIVFSWGLNNHGQLGLGERISSQATPKQLKILSGLPLAQIAAGGTHSFALSLSGTVFGWGNNCAGQLGLGNGTKAEYFKPCLAAEMKQIGVSFISCGQDHTALLTKDGRLYTCGDGTYGQLGHGSELNEYSPRRVMLPNGKISQLTCGSHHTVVYLPDSDMVISFGSGTLGQLGSGALRNEASPSILHTGNNDESPSAFMTDFKNAAVKIIFAGMDVNFIQMLPSQESADADSLPIGLMQIPKIDAASLEKWMAVEDGSQEQINAKRELASVFSSCAAVNASFLKLSIPDSLEDCSSALGVDLQAARHTLRKLTEKNWIADEIYFSLKRKLIPDLLEIPPHKEACTVFLILPECSVMQNDHYSQSLVIPFARAIAQLSQPKIITKLWSSLQPSFLNNQLKMFKQAVVHLFQTWRNTLQYNSDMKTLLCVLKLLYKANAKAQSSLPLNKFYIKEIPFYISFTADLINWRVRQKQPDSVQEDAMPFTFCCFPFLLDLLTKVLVLHTDSQLKKQVAKDQIALSFNYELIQGNRPPLPELPVFYLKINQKNIIESTLRQLNAADDSHFRKELVVHFVGEEGLNQRREFFLYIFEEMVQQNNRLLTFLDNDSVIWFPANPSEEKKKYFLFGILCGLALYNSCIVYLPFPLALFKKLLDIVPTFEDFKSIDPNYGRTLQYLLDYNYEDLEENFTIFFEVSWDGTEAELVPDGKLKPVNNTNKQEYVDKFVDYVFNKSVKTIFEEFKRGFYKVCDMEIVEFFQPEELMEVMVGNIDYDWDKLKKNTGYLGEYSQSHPTIKMFWSVFHELRLNEKKDFLLFLTGISRIPVTGMDSVKIDISPFNPVSPDSTDHLPEARTCYNLLLLPKYDSEEILKEKLLRAIKHNRGLYRD